MNNNQTQNLIHNLRLLRMEKHITATQLSYDLHLNSRRIGDIETNARTAIKEEEAIGIAKYFNITVETLIDKKAYVAFQ